MYGLCSLLEDTKNGWNLFLWDKQWINMFFIAWGPLGTNPRYPRLVFLMGMTNFLENWDVNGSFLGKYEGINDIYIYIYILRSYVTLAKAAWTKTIVLSWCVIFPLVSSTRVWGFWKIRTRYEFFLVGGDWKPWNFYDFSILFGNGKIIPNWPFTPIIFSEG